MGRFELHAAAAAAILSFGCGSGTRLTIEYEQPDAAVEASPTPSPESGDGTCTPNDRVDCEGACGQIVGRCGTLIQCGGCVSGACGGAGQPNVCGAGTCSPSCEGKTCGASDDCGAVCSEGSCPAGEHCNGATCVCDATSCVGCCTPPRGLACKATTWPGAASGVGHVPPASRERPACRELVRTARRKAMAVSSSSIRRSTRGTTVRRTTRRRRVRARPSNAETAAAPPRHRTAASGRCAAATPIRSALSGGVARRTIPSQTRGTCCPRTTRFLSRRRASAVRARIRTSARTTLARRRAFAAASGACRPPTWRRHRECDSPWPAREFTRDGMSVRANGAALRGGRTRRGRGMCRQDPRRRVR